MTTETLELPGHAIRDRVQTPGIIRVKRILVLLDFSEMSLNSLDYAVPFARLFGAGITLLHIVPTEYPTDFPYPPPFDKKEMAALQKQLEDIRIAKIPPEMPVTAIVRQDSVFEGIIEVARDIRADLVIITTHGRTGLKRLLMGSTAEQIARDAPCPVLVVREVENEFVRPC
ncbi:MAG TPA: universal stress protein [Chthoniobacterales bacterium]